MFESLNTEKNWSFLSSVPLYYTFLQDLFEIKPIKEWIIVEINKEDQFSSLLQAVLMYT